MAICAVLLNVHTGGGGAWIDLSCWDTLVEAHRTELAMNQRRGPGGEPYNGHDHHLGALYNTYLMSDGKIVLLAALEAKFWSRFCDKSGRPDLINRHTGGAIEFGGEDDGLRQELIEVFASATADEWDARFVDWDVPGSKVLQAGGHEGNPLRGAANRRGRAGRVAEHHKRNQLAPRRRTRGLRPDTAAGLGGGRRHGCEGLARMTDIGGVRISVII
jgi:crotonobetainyl-CoA:carnitine CoA-transferase CaiB-like acyl-CoA transferase